MTVYKNINTIIEKDDYTAEDLMRLRRERVRDRRLRKGSLISGQILSITPTDHLIAYEPADFDKAI